MLNSESNRISPKKKKKIALSLFRDNFGLDSFSFEIVSIDYHLIDWDYERKIEGNA